jgi:hypothetical protein
MTTPPMIVTASLSSGIACIAHGLSKSTRLIEKVLATEHTTWETTLYVGDIEFHTSKAGPYPNHQMRVSVRPAVGYAALNYMDHDDPQMSIANSYNPQRPPPEVNLIFSGITGLLFPRSAAIPVAAARRALDEWLRTRKRPTCIEWRPFDTYNANE